MPSIKKMHFFTILLCYGISSTESQLSIPDEFKECYVNNSMQSFRLPMNLRVLVDIIRKAETHAYTTMDLRAMSSSLMHRFKLDGIEYYKDIEEADGILPFGQSGKQSVKYKLIRQMVPGKPEIFPFNALTAVERCTLHQAVSNTIMMDSSRDTNLLCQEIGQKLRGNAVFADLWNCPKEYGVILTSHGTVAPGAIIAAIAASLQHQDVGLNLILNVTTERPTNISVDSVDYAEQVDFIIPRHEMIHDRSMSYSSSPGSKSWIELDNVWLATIAGDLAEMVIYQGPILNSRMELGATGFWNNTMRPSVFYLKNKNGYFDATRAEIVGDIDGLIIASHVQAWMDNFNSLRLSQILDMYYTDEGINLLNENVKVCDRGKAFSHVAPKLILSEQTLVVSDILASYNDIVFTSTGAHERMVDNAVANFFDYTNNHLLTEVFCRNGKRHPQVEALIVFDGAWNKEYTMDFVATLIDDLDISMYGSKMGILHGTTGQWLLNVTNSPSLAYYAVSNFTKISWPTHLNFIATLNAVHDYLNDVWETKWQLHKIGSLGQAIVILAPLTRLTETEQQIILKLLQEIKYHYPGLYFLYYVSEHNSYSFQPFILSEHDRLIFSSHIDDITEFLLTVPRTLRPIPKLMNVSSELKNEMEDYISPLKSITYILNPQYIVETKTTITVHNFGYGAITVCSWSQFKIEDKIENQELVICQQVDAHKNIISVNDFNCINTDIACPYLFVRVQNATSLNKCAEIECRSPNQVRYIIRMQNYNSASKNTFVNIFVISFLYLQLAIFNM